MKPLSAVLLVLSLAGCTARLQWDREAVDAYSRAETNSIITEKACLDIARTQVQVARCSIRR
jgi:hypothetical protein